MQNICTGMDQKEINCWKMGKILKAKNYVSLYNLPLSNEKYANIPKTILSVRIIDFKVIFI